MKKRILSMLLTILMVLGLMPASVLPAKAAEETTPASAIYTVIGAIAPGHVEGGMLGIAWNASNTDNDLSWNEATNRYEITYTNVPATGPTEVYDDTWYEFQIAEDHNWNKRYPDDANEKFTVEKDGSTVVIAFDGETISVVVTSPTDNPDQPTPNTYNVTVTDDGNGTATANPATGATGTEVTLTATPAAGYRFKEWQVLAGGVTVENNTFTIGTADVAIKAVFETDIYGLAGSFNNYDPTDPNYDMSRGADGSYVLQKEFDEGTHQFHIVKNHAWDTPSGTSATVVLENGTPASVSVSADLVRFTLSSKANVTVVFDPAAMTVTANWEENASKAASVTANGVTTEYPTVSAALQAAASSTSADTVLKLLDDVTEHVNINSGVFTLDLNGKSVNGSQGVAAVTLNSGNIVITDSSAAQTGTIKGTYRALSIIGNGAVCEIRGGSIEGNNETVAIESGAELTVTGGTIDATDNGSIGVMALFGCEVIVTGGTISGGNIGVSADRSRCEIRGGSIEGSMYGVSVVNEGSSCEISGGSISSDNYGVLAAVDSCTISGGTVAGEIFGVFVADGNCSIRGGTVEGGSEAVAVSSSAELSITGGTFSHDPSNYVAEGYAAAQNAGGKWVVAEKQITLYPLWLGGEQVTSERLTVSDGNGGTATYDPETNTLTLTNYTYEGAGHDYDMLSSAAIYAQADLNVVLEGDSSLTNTADYGECLVSEQGDITISGEGSLAINAYTGIYTGEGSCTISGGSLTIEAKNYGVYTGKGDVIVSGGEVNVVAEDSGVYASTGNITVSGGKVGIVADVHGFYAKTNNITVSGGEVNIAADVHGIIAYNGNVTVSGGKVEIAAGYYGICANNDSGIANNGTVTVGGEVMITAEVQSISCITVNVDTDTLVVYGEDGKVIANPDYRELVYVHIKEKPPVTPYPVYVGGEQFTSEKLTVSDDNGGTATYDPTTNTLTLSNYTYEGAGLNRGNINAASCYLGRDTLNLVLKGSNTVTQTGSAVSNNNFGVLVYGALTVSGSGTLTVIGGQANATVGVYAAGDITVSGGTIAAAGGQAGARSCGVYANGAITVSGTGTLTGTGGSATGYSFGVYAGGAITVSDAGTLTGTGGLATGNSFGVYPDGAITVSGGTLIAEGSTRALGKAPVIADTHAVYGNDGKVIANPDHSTMTYARIALKTVAEVNGTPYLTIEDALSAVASSTTTDTVLKLLADVEDAISIGGGTFTLDLNGHSITGSSYGLYISAGDITVTDSLTGGTITSNNYGVYVDGGSVSITDGTFNGAYGVYSNNGEVTVSGGNIMGNDIGVCTSMNSTLTITGGTIRGNNSGVTAANGNVSISGGTLNGNYSVHCQSDTKLTISGGTFNSDSMGVVAVGAANASITGGTINSGSDGVSFMNVSEAIITGGRFTGARFGVYSFNSTVTITDGTIYGSDTGVVADMGSNLSVTGGSITGEQSGVLVNESELSITGGSFSHDPSNWVAEGYKAKWNSETELYDVVKGYKVEIEQPEDGKVETDNDYPAPGDDVTVTVTPDEGKEVADVIVKDENGNEIPVTKNEDGSYTYEQPAGDVTVEVTFKDIPSSDDDDDYEPTYRPSIEKTEGGDTTVDKKNPTKGDKVTITTDPDKGYVAGKVTVTDSSGNPVEVIDNGDGTFTYVQPSGKVTIVVEYVPAASCFTDVAEESYYYDAVNWAVAKGITSGTSATTFSPNNPCTRGQMATFLWRAAGSPEPKGTSNPFKDVTTDAYYAKAILWAVEQGITMGTGATTFSPDDPCTRAQMATFIYRCEQANGGGFTGAWMFLLPFTDTPEWAYEPIAWCYKEGITSGTSATTFSPDDPCTRAQIMTFLYRFFMG